ncbi:hypothetical protein [Granulicoccus phenolivorans]|nr:hypothetical protein [Granulicoccus phenolivorans]
MSLVQTLRTRHHAARTTRAINRVIRAAATSTMRDELIAVSQRQYPRH